MKAINVTTGILAFVTVLMSAGACMALSPVNKSFFSGVAIGGYDSVAYFTEGRAVKGSEKYVYKWQGAEWRFSSVKHLKLFRAAPDRYAPQYGGYCAWAVSQGTTAGVDPTLWKIVDHKLYLNYDKSVQLKWEKDVAGNIEKADENWPGLLKK